MRESSGVDTAKEWQGMGELWLRLCGRSVWGVSTTRLRLSVLGSCESTQLKPEGWDQFLTQLFCFLAVFLLMYSWTALRPSCSIGKMATLTLSLLTAVWFRRVDGTHIYWISTMWYLLTFTLQAGLHVYRKRVSLSLGLHVHSVFPVTSLNAPFSLKIGEKGSWSSIFV